MKLFKLMKDGGKESRVSGFFFVEWKRFFSIVLLHFRDGSREAYHEHAFNSVSWVLKGCLAEYMLNGFANIHVPGWRPVITNRKDFHKVKSIGDTYVLSFRGPWIDKWREYLPESSKFITLTHGRKVVD